MSITPFDGPILTRRANPLGPFGSGSANQNPQESPSVFLEGTMLLDPRAPYTFVSGGDVSAKTYGWVSTRCLVVNQVPSTISAVNIAASQSPGAGAITLVSSSGAGITVGVSITRADTGAAVTGLLAIDSTMAAVAYGQDGTINAWDPTKAISRNVRIVSGGDDSGITFTVTGYDLYGYPMSEAITGANAGTASGVKAFKYISAVTHTGSVATTVTIGTGDVYGFPLRCDYFSEPQIYWNNTAITASTGFVAAVTTSPATTTTGDVRGTYATQSASDNTKRLQIYVSPSAANVSSITGLLGVAQNLASNNG